MLDAYIIQKIKREEEAETTRPPLHIEVPFEAPPREGSEDMGDETPEDRGVVIVDFSL